jgi:hypothetical protein
MAQTALILCGWCRRPETKGPGVRLKAREQQVTLTVLGHQIVRKPEAYGLRLRTQELGDVVFSVPPAILRRLITDLTHLTSSSPALQTFGSGDAAGQPRGKIGARHS